MKITVICGSPRENGTSMLLADRFIEGMKEKGHEITRIKAAFMDIKSCWGCNYCRGHNGECVHKDDMEVVKKAILKADMVVFVSPLYYFGMTVQIKRVIDRFYAFNEIIRQQHKKAVLLATCASEDIDAMASLKMHYKLIVQYLKWTDVGNVIANAVPTRESIEQTDFPKKAYDLGYSLG